MTGFPARTSGSATMRSCQFMMAYTMPAFKMILFSWVCFSSRSRANANYHPASSSRSQNKIVVRHLYSDRRQPQDYRAGGRAPPGSGQVFHETRSNWKKAMLSATEQLLPEKASEDQDRLAADFSKAGIAKWRHSASARTLQSPEAWSRLFRSEILS